MRAKGLGELVEGIYGIGPQTIKPSHRHKSQVGGKHFAHQNFVLRVDSHPLVKLAHMFHKIHSTIVNGERGLMESLRKFRPLYLMLERWFWDLIQRLAHGVISQAFTRRAIVSTFMMALFIVRESFAWWSSRPSSITVILFIVRGRIRTGGSLFPLCTV